MTDYLYSLSLAHQTKAFLFSLGFGFIAGAAYDIFRIVRMSVSKARAAYIISDLLYCILLCVCSFLFFLSVNEGEFRLYLFIGEAAGFFVWYFSIGAALFAASERIIGFIKKASAAVFKAIFFPIRKAFGGICGIFNRILKKSRKNSKKLKNKSNFLLKVNKHLLYNLNIRKKIPVNDRSPKKGKCKL